jgi:hypothetical protein
VKFHIPTVICAILVGTLSWKWTTRNATFRCEHHDDDDGDDVDGVRLRLELRPPTS